MCIWFQYDEEGEDEEGRPRPKKGGKKKSQKKTIYEVRLQGSGQFIVLFKTSYCIANIYSIKFKNGGNDIFYTGTNTHVELLWFSGKWLKERRLSIMNIFP